MSRPFDGPHAGDPPTVLQSADVVELNRALTEAQARIRDLEAVIEADRTRIIDGVNALDKVLHGRFWLTEGRGPYEWNDDRYRKEFGDAARAVLKAVEPLRKIGADLTNCPPTTAEVLAARRNKDAEITRLAGDVLRYKETSENYLEAIRKFDADVLALEEKLAKRDARIAELERALERIMVAGNSLASALVGLLGAKFSIELPYGTDPAKARERIADPDYYDLWLCWSGIMQERDKLAALSTSPAPEHPDTRRLKYLADPMGASIELVQDLLKNTTTLEEFRAKIDAAMKEAEPK